MAASSRVRMENVEYAVKCPSCSAKAIAIMKPAGVKGTYREPTLKMGLRRLLCKSCGLSKEITTDDVDAYELWYATNFRGHRLWAVNRDHLSLLISWLSGDLPKKEVRLASSSSDHFGERVIVESLPKWMGLAKNRPQILKSLRKMYET
jgi:transcription elongation factor Elf1